MYRELLKDTAIIGFGNIFSRGIVFFLIPLQTSVMSKSEYGLAEMLFNLVNILIPIFTLGIAEAGMRFAIGAKEDQEKVFSIITIVPFFGSAILLVLLAPVMFVYQEYREYCLSLIFLFFFFSYKDIYLQFCKGVNYLRIYALGSILFSVSLLVLSYIFLVTNSYDVNGYMYSYVLANFVTVVYLLIYGRFYKYFAGIKDAFDIILCRLMVSYSLPLICNLLAWWITGISNRYVIAYYCTLEDVGVYSALAKFSLILTTIFGVFFQSWQINAAKNINIKDRSSFFTKVHDIFIISLIIVSSIFLMFSGLIASMFLRGGFVDSLQYLPGIVITGTACCMPMYWGAIYGALKDTKGAFYSTFCGSIGSVLFNFLLIPAYGIYGAIASTVISYIIVTVYRAYELNRMLEIRLSVGKNLCGFIVLAMQALGLSLCLSSVGSSLINFISIVSILMLYKTKIKDIFCIY